MTSLLSSVSVSSSSSSLSLSSISAMVSASFSQGEYFAMIHDIRKKDWQVFRSEINMLEMCDDNVREDIILTNNIWYGYIWNDDIWDNIIRTTKICDDGVWDNILWTKTSVMTSSEMMLSETT